MSTTVLDALQNAKYNLETAKRQGDPFAAVLIPLAMEQLNNAIAALENGKGPDDTIQEHMLGGVDTGA